MTRWGALFLLLLVLLSAPAGAQRRMSVSLVPETTGVLPGSTLTVALVMRPAAGWHGYWRNPGDAGAEPRVRWRLPEGWSAEPLQYPAPHRLLVMGLMNYVFEGEYALLATIRVPADAEPGVASPIDARLDYLVCTNELCVPEEATVSVELSTVAPGAPNPAFAGYRQALPRPLAQEGRFQVEGDRIRIAVPVPAGTGLREPYFYPATIDSVRHAAPQRVSRGSDMLVFETGAGPRAAGMAAIEGVVALSPGVALSLTLRPGEVVVPGQFVATTGGANDPANGAPPPGGGTGPPSPNALGGEGEGASILFALLGALLGGLILNVMPCVFPILSLKALSLARAGPSEGAARREALAYSAGAILICLALGGMLLALRAAGVAAGWAFQLQDPRIILVLLLLVTAITLNLAGLFRLPTLGGGEELAGQGGTRGAFFTGALAAFVATPCTGPFLGFALGAALVLPTWAALAVFAGLGLGLALPFLLLGFVPALRRRLPKPGPWMRRFQRFLALPMALTALGLAWVLSRQTGTEGLALGLGAAVLLGLGLWWLGRRQDGRTLWPAAAVVVLAVLLPLPFLRTVASPAAQAGLLGAEPFSEARLAALRAQGPVFVYFTADWCLTCKVNERAVLDRAEVLEHFRARGIRTLVGDWTSGDPAITRFLGGHGRSGVPLYLFYAPGREAEVMPQLLTVGRMTALGS